MARTRAAAAMLESLLKLQRGGLLEMPALPEGFATDREEKDAAN